MNMHSTPFLVGVHFWISYANQNESNAHLSRINTETVLYVWGLFATLLCSCHILLQGNSSPRYETYCVLNKYTLLTCSMLVSNVAVSVFACNSLAYCFMCHAVLCVTCEAILDDSVNHNVRAIMVFVFALLFASVALFPVAIHTHMACDAAQGMLFETAHLWGIVITCTTYSLFSTVFTLCTRW